MAYQYTATSRPPLVEKKNVELDTTIVVAVCMTFEAALAAQRLLSGLAKELGRD